MSLIRWQSKQTDPVKEFFNEDVLNFPLSAFIDRSLNQARSAWYPAIDIAEEKDKFILKADLPGMKKEDVRVSVEDGILTIEGERKSETEQRDINYHRVERTYGKFVRSLNLGTAADASKIKASYKDGVLEVLVPKLEKAKAKTIDVEVQ